MWFNKNHKYKKILTYKTKHVMNGDLNNLNNTP